MLIQNHSDAVCPLDRPPFCIHSILGENDDDYVLLVRKLLCTAEPKAGPHMAKNQPVLGRTFRESTRSFGPNQVVTVPATTNPAGSPIASGGTP